MDSLVVKLKPDGRDFPFISIGKNNPWKAEHNVEKFILTKTYIYFQQKISYCVHLQNLNMFILCLPK